MARQEYVHLWNRDQPRWGRLEGQSVLLLTAPPWLGGVEDGDSLGLQGLDLLVPALPTKVLCIGLNYRDHAKEMGLALPTEPLLFMKPTTACLGAGEPIVIPAASQQVDYEAELALLIGKRVGPGMDTTDAIFGYTCANDVTARDLQKKDGQWTRAKGFDSFCPLGPTLVTGIDVSDIAIRCLVNGVEKQSSRTKELIFSPEAIVKHLAGIMTLLPGDIILTGTPSGIGPLKAGDVVEVHIEGVGRLQNPVR